MYIGARLQTYEQWLLNTPRTDSCLQLDAAYEFVHGSDLLSSVLALPPRHLPGPRILTLVSMSALDELREYEIMLKKRMGVRPSQASPPGAATAAVSPAEERRPVPVTPPAALASAENARGDVQRISAGAAPSGHDTDNEFHLPNVHITASDNRPALHLGFASVLLDEMRRRGVHHSHAQSEVLCQSTSVSLATSPACFSPLRMHGITADTT